MKNGGMRRRQPLLRLKGRWSGCEIRWAETTSGHGSIRIGADNFLPKLALHACCHCMLPITARHHAPLQHPAEARESGEQGTAQTGRPAEEKHRFTDAVSKLWPAAREGGCVRRYGDHTESDLQPSYGTCDYQPCKGRSITLKCSGYHGRRRTA